VASSDLPVPRVRESCHDELYGGQRSTHPVQCEYWLIVMLVGGLGSSVPVLVADLDSSSGLGVIRSVGVTM